MTKKEVKKEEECEEKVEDVAEEVTGTDPVVEDSEDSKVAYREMKLAKRAAKKKARKEKTGRYAEVVKVVEEKEEK